MPNINDRIGSQNVIRVLSNASAPPTRLLNLTDVNSSSQTDGNLLVWDKSSESFLLTNAIDSPLLNITGIVTFTNTTNSSASTNGALVVEGGVGISKVVNIGEGIVVSGISTFASNLDINAAVDILNGLTVNSTFKSVGITTLSSAGGITTTGGELYVGTNLEVAGTSNFIGNATFRGGTIGIGDSSTDDIDVGGEFVSNLVPNTDNTFDIGITTQRWRDGKFSGLVTTTNLFVSGVSTFLGDKNVTGNLRITGFASVTEGLYYDSNDYDGPNGIAYFDNTGKLIGAASTENALTESYFVLTTNNVGIPTWTSVIDGGSY